MSAPVRTGPNRFVKRMKRLFLVLSIVLIPVIMIVFVLAVNSAGGARIGFFAGGAAALILYLALYCVYAMKVSMSTVLALETTDKVVYITTKRGTYTYDVLMGCVGAVKKGKKVVCTFETMDSRDSFVFYLHAPLSKYSDGQFTEKDIRSFYPRFGE